MTGSNVAAIIGPVESEIDGDEPSESATILKADSAQSDLPTSSAPATAPYRTRWIYFSLFIFYSCGGRFMSLYYLAEGLDEAQIGMVFAVASLTSPLVSTGVGVLADKLALRSPAARHWCLVVCVLSGTFAFTLQAFPAANISRFSQMLICRIVTNGCTTSASILTDAITVQGIEDRKAFGQERLYGAVSWAIMHLLLGILIDMYGRVVQHVLILGACVLVILTIVVAGVPSPKKNIEQAAPKAGPGLAALADCTALRDLLRTYMSSRSTLAFFFYAIALGYGMTIVENLIFLLFRELEASYFLCGVSVVVTVVFEIPLFYCSKGFLERWGVPALLAAAGLCYSFRVIGYTLCPGGWFVLLFEPMHGITIAAWSTASVELVASITPDTLTATGQAFMNLVRSGVGSTAGNSIGGAIIRSHGQSACYRSSAVVVLCGLSIYWLNHRSTAQSEQTADAVTDTEKQEAASILPVSLGRSANHIKDAKPTDREALKT